MKSNTSIKGTTARNHFMARGGMLLSAIFALATLSLSFGAALAGMNPAQKAIYDSFVAQARQGDPSFKGFSAARGKTFFHSKQSGGKNPEINSCTHCHTNNLQGKGKTRAGKDIEAMAASVNPKRYTDPDDVAKWFRRNCGDVLGRECTIMEKGDVLAYLLSI